MEKNQDLRSKIIKDSKSGVFFGVVRKRTNRKSNFKKITISSNSNIFENHNHRKNVIRNYFEGKKLQ